jgi:hypothetical protein
MDRSSRVTHNSRRSNPVKLKPINPARIRRIVDRLLDEAADRGDPLAEVILGFDEGLKEVLAEADAIDPIRAESLHAAWSEAIRAALLGEPAPEE